MIKFNNNTILVGLSTLIIVIGLFVQGIKVTPDGSSYLGGAYSLNKTFEFRNFCSEIITVFQPLYSLVIAFFIRIFNSIGLSIFIVNSLLLIGTSIIYTRTSNIQSIYFSLVTLILFNSYKYVFAENLGTVLYFLLIYLLEKPIKIEKKCILSFLLITLLFFTKNSYLFFTIPLVIYFVDFGTLKKTILISGIFILSNLILFILIKFLLGNVDSHRIVKNIDFKSLTEAATYIVNPLNNTLSAITFPILYIGSILYSIKNKDYKHVFVFVLTICILIVVFSLVEISDPLGERFLFPLVMLFLINGFKFFEKYSIMKIVLIFVTLFLFY